MRKGDARQAAAALAGLMRVVERLTYVPREVAKTAAPKLDDLLDEQYEAGVDPYGRPWRPLKSTTLAKGRRPPPLTDTRRLRDGTRAKPGRAGIRLTVAPRYGVFHQYGFRVGRARVAPRRILPTNGMPAAWRAVLKDAARSQFKAAVR